MHECGLDDGIGGIFGGFFVLFQKQSENAHNFQKNRKNAENNYFLTLYPVNVAKAIGLFVSSDTVTL